MAAFKSIAQQAPITVAYVQTAAAGTAPDAYVFINPLNSGEYFQIVEVRGIWDVAGGAAAAADIKICTNGQAPSAGTTAVTAGFDLTTGARSPTKLAITTTVANRLIAPGSSVAVDTSGTLTALAGLCILVIIKPIIQKKVH